jgi:hypothetical protein
MRGKGDVIPLGEITRKAEEDAIGIWFGEHPEWANRRKQWVARLNSMVRQSDVHNAIHATLKARQGEEPEACCLCGRWF